MASRPRKTRGPAAPATSVVDRVPEPLVFPIGALVTAKCGGAFCEAEIKGVTRNVEVTIKYESGRGTAKVSDENIQGTILIGEKVKVKDTKSDIWLEAVVKGIKDQSEYKVEFDDEDIQIFRRNKLRHRGGRHFEKEYTMSGGFPLLDPKSFSSPVGQQREVTRVPAESMNLDLEFSGTNTPPPPLVRTPVFRKPLPPSSYPSRTRSATSNSSALGKRKASIDWETQNVTSQALNNVLLEDTPRAGPSKKSQILSVTKKLRVVRRANVNDEHPNSRLPMQRSQLEIAANAFDSIDQNGKGNKPIHDASLAQLQQPSGSDSTTQRVMQLQNSVLTDYEPSRSRPQPVETVSSSGSVINPNSNQMGTQDSVSVVPDFEPPPSASRRQPDENGSVQNLISIQLGMYDTVLSNVEPPSSAPSDPQPDQNVSSNASVQNSNSRHLEHSNRETQTLNDPIGEDPHYDNRNLSFCAVQMIDRKVTVEIGDVLEVYHGGSGFNKSLVSMAEVVNVDPSLIIPKYRVRVFYPAESCECEELRWIGRQQILRNITYNNNHHQRIGAISTPPNPEETTRTTPEAGRTCTIV